jgi:hypothetical protein
VALLAMTAGYGVFVGMALVIAFVCGTAFASLNYLEDEAKGAEK